MSQLNYLEKLLDGVDVEWKSFGEIAKIQRGASPRPIAKFITDDEDGVPWIKIGDTESGSKYVEQTAQKITKEGATKSRVLKKGDFIISNSMSFGRPYILNITGAIHDGWASISEFGDKLNSDFLYHYLSSQSVQNYWISKINSGSVSNLNADIIKPLLVPIPCPNNPEKSLAIQAEIVRILDAFTAMTAELTAELNMRKKQYNYYRDQLLSFEEGEGVTPMSIGDIYDFQYGKGNTIPKEGGQYPVYGSNGVVGTHHEYNSEDSPVIGHIGAYAGIVNWGKGKHFVTYNGVICKHKSKEVNPQFAYYILLAQDFGSKAKNSSQPFVSYDTLKEPVVLIPSLAEQERIVSILDKFDALTNSITEGLPREIELRQKQYEYYRDLLLSFPKPHSHEAA